MLAPPVIQRKSTGIEVGPWIERQETRIDELERFCADIGDRHPLPDDAGERMDNIKLRHTKISALEGDLELQLSLFQNPRVTSDQLPAARLTVNPLGVFIY